MPNTIPSLDEFVQSSSSTPASQPPPSLDEFVGGHESDENSPGIRASSPGVVDHLRRFLFGGPESETALGRQFPSLSGAKISDTPTSDLPLVSFADLAPSGDGPVKNAVRGAASIATDLTTGKNLEILAATQGLGVLGEAAPLLGKAINTGLSTYFAYELGKGATQETWQAYKQFRAGDYDGMARSLGAGTMSTILAALAATHTEASFEGLGKEIADRIDEHNDTAAALTMAEAAQHGTEPPGEPQVSGQAGPPQGKKPVRTRVKPVTSTPAEAPPSLDQFVEESADKTDKSPAPAASITPEPVESTPAEPTEADGGVAITATPEPTEADGGVAITATPPDATAPSEDLAEKPADLTPEARPEARSEAPQPAENTIPSLDEFVEKPKKAHEMLFEDWQADPRSSSVPKSHILARNPADEGFWDDLAAGPKSDMQALATVMSAPTSGTKAELVSRLQAVWDLRTKLSAATVESLQAIPGSDLKAMAQTAGTWAGGNKFQLAQGLIGWRDQARRNGTRNLQLASWNAAIAKAQAAGIEISPEVQTDHQRLNKSQFQLEQEMADLAGKQKSEPAAETPERPTLEAPVTYFTGAAAHYSDVQQAARERNDFGLVITPNTNHYSEIAAPFKHVMVDNGVFSKAGFDPDKFQKLLDRIEANPELKKKVQFVVAPDAMVHDEATGDVRGDAEKTLELFNQWEPELHKRGFPVAFVAQPGAEHMLDRIPWSKIDTLFIGGHKAWKFSTDESAPPGSPDAIAFSKMFSEAIKRDIPIHVGRVYRAKDIEHVHMNMGVKSVDSTHIGFEPSRALPFILKQLDKWNVHNENPPDYEKEKAYIAAEERLEAQEAAAKQPTPQVTEPPEGTKYVLPSFVTAQYAKDQKPVTIDTSDEAAQQPAGVGDRAALAEQLPEGSSGTPEGGKTRNRSRSGSGASRARKRADARSGQELDASGGSGPTGVGDTSEREGSVTEQRPRRAEHVSSNRLERDFRIPDDRNFRGGSPENRARNNIAVLKLVKELEAENRPATVEEQSTLAKYGGWGPVPQIFAANTPEWKALQDEFRSLVSDEEYEDARRSSTNANYTEDDIARAMWTALVHMGAKPGMSYLEPAVGAGVFFGTQPAELLEGARRVGMDKDKLTATIAKYLYPDSGIDNKAFEEAELPNDYFDAAISNVPFGNFGVHDASFKGRKFLTSSIHNYFFAKSLDLVRPGGVVAFITSRYTMDGAEEAAQLRKWIDARADFLGAVRLPNNAMQGAGGTHVITDVIFLRKRLPGAEPAGQAWLETPRKMLPHDQWGGTYPASTNEYYHANPSNVIGTEQVGRSQFSAYDYKIKGTVERAGLEEKLKQILPADAFEAWQRNSKSKRIALREINAPAEQSKLGALFFDEKGDLYRKTSKGSAEPVDVAKPMKDRIRAQMKIRDVLVKLLAGEQSDQPTAVLNSLRAALNSAYDDFVKKFGPLSMRTNAAAMYGDPEAPLLVTLEKNFDPKAKTAQKAPIFERRMLTPARKVESAKDAKDALYVALNETGSIDWARMSELTGKTPEELQGELAAENLVFRDPKTRAWQTAEEYLSGSVRSKLKEARKLAKLEPAFERNVEALEKVQPEDIPPGEIHAALGVTWVPAETYAQFAQEVLNTSRPVKVTHIGNEWIVADSGSDRGASKWGTARVPAIEILRDAINMRRTKVYDREADGSTTLNKTETLTAQAKQRELQEHFNKWLFLDDAKRGAEMASLYNDLNNDLRLRTYDGAHLTLPGMTRDLAVVRGGDLEPHQKAAIWRTIAQRNVLLAHWVGTGKTFEMIASGMELQRLGLIKRPMYVVPNATLTGWQLQFNALYPQKRVLVFSEKDLEKKKRQQVMAQIATGDWDAVIVPESSFGFLRVGDEIFNEHHAKLERELEEQVEAAQEAGLDTRIIKRLEKMKERLLTGLQDKRNAERQDNTVTWEQLGIDQLFVDEAHNFKKLGFTTKQQNVAGIDQNGNQKTFDLLMKMRHVQKHGRGVVFATGTPVTNTMGELFNLMKYLIEGDLEARGLDKFDDWAANFGRTVDVFEPKPEGGGYQMKARFSSFVNLPELAQLFRSFADVVTSDMVNLPRPEIAGGGRRAVEMELSPAQQHYLDGLRKRAKSIRDDPRGSMPDNMLAVYGDAGKMTLDMRLVDPDAEDEPGNRVDRAADEIAKLYREHSATKATQLVFSDLGIPGDGSGKNAGFSIYDELTKKLIARGIPANEIATVYQAKNKQQRAKLFADTNAGKIRVLMGSTMKLGVGVNVQQKVVAMHHLDIPHRPADLDQREGRGIRQGNENPAVHILYYVTKGSLDESKFANVLRKAKFINQVLQGKSTVRSAEDVSGMVPSLEMFTAMASGDPRVLRKIEVDAEVDRLGSVFAGWRNEQYKNARELDLVPGRLKSLERRGAALQKAIASRDKGRIWTVGKQKFEGEGIRDKVGAALDKLDPKEFSRDEWEKVATAYGMPVEARQTLVRASDKDGTAQTTLALQYRMPETNSIPMTSESGKGIVQQIENYVKSFEADLDQNRRAIERTKEDAKAYQESLDKPWSHAAEYQKLIEEQKKLIAELGSDKGDSSTAAFDDNEEIQDSSVKAETPEAAEDDSEDEEEEEQPKRTGTGDVYLGSGLGALQPVFERFWKDDVVPTAKQVAELTAATRDDLRKIFAPASRGPQAKTAALSVRANAAELARSTDRAEAALQVARRFFDKQPRQANYDFIDRVESGQPQPNGELQAFADQLRQMLDGRRAQIQALGTGKLQSFIQDYFPHVWKNPRTARQVIQNWTKNPMQGSKSFLKKRSIDTFADGIAAGLVPESDNPIDMVLAKVREMDKYLTAHHILQELKDEHLLRYRRSTQPMPAGYAKINDSVATVYGTPSHPGALQIEGEYVAPEPAARILNNYLSPGLRERSGAFRAYLGIANLINQAQLSFSAFHLGFTTIDAVTSRFALGVYQAAHGDFLEGAKTMATTPASPFTTMMKGDKLFKEWYSPGTQGAQIAELVDALTKAGGRPTMEGFYQTHYVKRLMTAFRSGNIFGALLRVPGAALEAAVYPIMQYVVPRQKLGVFADMAAYELERLGPNASEAEARAALARAWDSVDNRLGQLVYDNLFWEKVAKDLSMASVRSVGWNTGTIREIFGANLDAIDMARGRTDFTHRMAYTYFALPIVAGLIGATLYYLWNGKAPNDLYDYYFPRFHGHRMALPSYIKDVYEWTHDPLRTAEGKVHPLLGTIVEMLENRDYFDKPIMNRHHSLVRRAEELAEYAAKQFIPIAYRDKPHVHPDTEERMLQFVGVKRAPKAIDKKK